MADGVGGCEALVFALLSAAPDVPNAAAAVDLVLRAAVATSYIADHTDANLRYDTKSSTASVSVSVSVCCPDVKTCPHETLLEL